jgi:hypothetical protein
MPAGITGMVLLNAITNGWPVLVVCGAGLYLLLRDGGAASVPARLAVVATAMVALGILLHPFTFSLVRAAIDRVPLAERMGRMPTLNLYYQIHAMAWSAWQAVALSLYLQAVRIGLRRTA